MATPELIILITIVLWAVLVVFCGCLNVPSYRILFKALLLGLPLSAAIILGYAAFLKSLGIPIRFVDLWKPSVALQGWMCVSIVLWFISAHRHLRAMILERSMSDALDPGCHAIEVEIRYLTTAEGGRKDGVSSGYRGQFYYQGEDWDGFQHFPDFSDCEIIHLGRKVRALVQFRQEWWDEIHSKRIYVGMPFEIREGARTVGRGTVTKV